jgi:hypothetical protein
MTRQIAASRLQSTSSAHFWPFDKCPQALVENFFCTIKEFRRIATRYDKTDCSFKAAINLVGAFLALR